MTLQENQKKANAYLAQFKAHSPIDNTLLAEVARSSTDDVHRAATAADNAFADWADVTWRWELPFFRWPGRIRARRAVNIHALPDQHHQPLSYRPGRCHNTMEHTVHAVDMENRTCTRCRLYGGPQAGRTILSTALVKTPAKR